MKKSARGLITGYLYGIAMFAAGMTTAINLSALVGVNTSYDAQWWKVYTAIILAVLFTVAKEMKE